MTQEGEREGKPQVGSSPGSDSDRSTLGILFVHGIGDQPRGDTLSRFGDPVLRWLDRWLEHKNGRGKVVDAGPPAAAVGDPTPRHVVAEIEHPGHPSSRWILAESWWASGFQRPETFPLARWILSNGSWIVMTHFARPIAQKPHLLWFAPVMLLITLLALMALQLAVGITVILALIPIPALQNYFSKLLLTISGSLGDAYTITTSPAQAGSAVAQVSRDLQWLAARCENVVVIAHSQGARIAGTVWHTTCPKNACRLFMLGSGLVKLSILGQARELEPWAPTLAGWAPAALGLASYLALYPPVTGRLATGGSLVLVAGVVALFAWLLRRAWTIWREYVKAFPEGDSTVSDPEARTVDYYGALDPIPNGPIVPAGHVFSGCQSIRVNNRGSLITDHTTYMQNREEVLGDVLQRIDRVTGGRLFSTGDEEHLAEMRRKRAGRIRALAYGRILTLASIPMGLFVLMTMPQDVQVEFRRWLGGSLLTLPHVATLGDGLEDILSPWLGFVPGSQIGRITAVCTPLLAAIMGVSYLVSRRIWEIWDDFASDQMFRISTLGGREPLKTCQLLFFATASAPFLALLMSAAQGQTMLLGGPLIWMAAVCAAAFGTFHVVRGWSEVHGNNESGTDASDR